jgi:hypothetical protein
MQRLYKNAIPLFLLASVFAVSAYAEDVQPTEAKPDDVVPTEVKTVDTKPVEAKQVEVKAPETKQAEVKPVLICAEWKSAVPVNTNSLERLAKNSASDKPAKGLVYTKDQFVVLLGKHLADAKKVLANTKNELPKTSDGLVDLKGVTLNGFNLTDLNLDNVDFKGAEMNGADLTGSSLRGASLYKAELEGANLNNANLTSANVAKANLVNASLCQTVLIKADMEDADVLGAYMKGAMLDMTRHIPTSIYQNSQNALQFGMPVPLAKD